MSASSFKFSLHEDWVVVLLGFIIIVLAIVGVRPASPMYSWSSTSELQAKIFQWANLSTIGVQFLMVIFIALLGAVLTGKSVKYFLFSFPLVYVITIIALIVAGNKGVKAYNLEAVIFSLGIGLVIGNMFTLPQWFRSALSTELFVKIGLVILGTSIIFSDILRAGSYG